MFDRKLYDETKTKELDPNTVDLEKGYIINDTLIHHIDGVKGKKEKGHYEVVAEYDNGGKDIAWIVDEPGIEEIIEHDEEEPIQVYKAYSEEELLIKRSAAELESLMLELTSSDYQALKYAEGYYTEEEYKPIKEYRESLRERIRAITDIMKVK